MLNRSYQLELRQNDFPSPYLGVCLRQEPVCWEDNRVCLNSNYQDILYLIGLTFGKRDFVEMVDRDGLEAVFARAPYGDLAADQKAVFEAAINDPMVRQYIALWWSIYNHLQATGTIQPTDFWDV
jgi:hypothetical protein